MKKTLYLMRHGQTLFNVQHKIQGWCDSPLTELGKKQAMVAAEYFKSESISFTDAYSSTAERASDTLELITDQPYERVKGLKEWNFGAYEGKDECLNPKPPYGDFFGAFGGETQAECSERICSTIRELMDREGHESVLMVSHGGSLAVFYWAWQEYSRVEETSYFHNCCVLKYEYEDGIFSLVEIHNHDFSALAQDGGKR